MSEVEYEVRAVSEQIPHDVTSVLSKALLCDLFFHISISLLLNHLLEGDVESGISWLKKYV